MAQNLLQGTEIITVGQASVARAYELVTACSACSESAHRPFESVLNQILGGKGAIQYLLATPMECPRCGSTLLEGTRVSTCKTDVDLNPPAEEKTVAFLDENTLAEAESFISGCEYCEPDRAAIPFDQLLDGLTGYDPTVTEYITCHPARCPHCDHDVMGHTLIFSEQSSQAD